MGNLLGRYLPSAYLHLESRLDIVGFACLRWVYLTTSSRAYVVFYRIRPSLTACFSALLQSITLMNLKCSCPTLRFHSVEVQKCRLVMNIEAMLKVVRASMCF
jgi:hypothetical protein